MLRDLLCITTATVSATCSLRPPAAGGGGGKERRDGAGRGKERHVLSLYLSPYAPTLPLHQHLATPARPPASPHPHCPEPRLTPVQSLPSPQEALCTHICVCRLLCRHLPPLLSQHSYCPSHPRPSTSHASQPSRRVVKERLCVMLHVTLSGESHPGNAIQPNEGTRTTAARSDAAVFIAAGGEGSEARRAGRGGERGGGRRVAYERNR